MKKKRMIIGPVIVILILFAVALLMLRNNINAGIGTCIEAKNGRYLVVLDHSPVVMSQRSGDESVFSELNTGDKIFIVHDGIDQSYPGQTGLYFILKLSNGSESDVPEEIMTELQEMGWLNQSGDQA